MHEVASADVLLADDSEAGRGLVVGLLEQLGYAAVAVGDGAAAVEAASESPGRFGLALLDIDMPGMDGATTAQTIAGLPDPPPIVGLVVAGRQEEARAQAAGMAATLRKPVRRDALGDTVDRLFRDPTGAAPPVDRAHLAGYTAGDAALERELFDLFCGSAETYLAQLVGATNDEAWHRAAHTLKGAARGIGAFEVAARAEAAEVLVADRRNADARSAAIRTLRAAVACVRRAVHPERLALGHPAAPHNARL
jgi:CheY-like chemotaxis protein